MAFTFRGGAKILHRKITSKIPVTDLKGADIHLFPINQHIGSPLQPVVQVGDYVKTGQKIADAQEMTATPMHSSISGVVKEIGDTITIENDYKYELADTIKPITDVYKLTALEKLWVIRDAGIIGIGGMPAHINLHSEQQAQYLIINGAESEPYLTADHRLMVENPEEIIDGIEIIMKLTGVQKTYIGIETNKQSAIDKIRQAIRYNDKIDVVRLKPRYPQCEPKPLIEAILGKRIKQNQKPIDFGIIVENIETAYNVHMAFRKGMPVINRIVTVSGNAIAKPNNFRVPLGVPVSYLINEAGEYRQEPQMLISGGLISGIELKSVAVPIVKNTTGVLAMKKYER